MIVECAPIAGYTDYEFRKLLVKCGAKVVYTEMVSVAALFYGQKRSLEKTLELLKFDKVEGVKNVVQLFGKDPKHFEYAIKYLADNGYSFDEININMGCPAGKIVKNSEGVALMTKPDLARSIIECCVETSAETSGTPISVKMRLDNVFEIAKICEQSGVSKIIVHGRYARQGYSGEADWNAIAKIVRHVDIPVIANGDIRDRASAERCLAVTRAAGVMIARALIKFKYFDVNCKQYVCNEKGLVTFWRDNFIDRPDII